MFDVIIIGGGAAGLTAGIYTARKLLKTLIISPEWGGQTNLTSHIENYPGAVSINGPELMASFKDSAKKFGCEFADEKLIKISKNEDKSFKLICESNKEFKSKTIILTYGKVARKLNISGEDKFFGRGLSTCVTCDGFFYRDKTVAVIGGGNSAVEGALELSNISKKVYLVHRRNEFRADEITVKNLKNHSNLTVLLNHFPIEIKGDKFVTALVVKDNQTEKLKTIDLDGVFSEIGYVVDSSMVKDLVKINEKNEVIVNDLQETSCKGIFAAGDLTPSQFKQTVIAAGEGAKAALQAHLYLTSAKHE